MMPLAYLRGSERNAWARPGIVFFRLPCCCCQCSRDRRRETCTKVFYMDITRIDASSALLRSRCVPSIAAIGLFYF